MEYINKRLASKFYLFSIGLYGAIASVFGFLFLFQSVLGINPLISIFLGYFITALCRAFFDQLTIYELNPNQINIKNNFILALISACVLVVLYYFIKAPLGDWAIPVVVVISMKIIAQLRKILWPDSASRLPEFFKIYSQKIQSYMWGLYGFFFIIALITYQLVKLYGSSSFYFAFAFAVFIGLVFEQIYDLIKVYEIKPTIFSILFLLVIALVFSVLC